MLVIVLSILGCVLCLLAGLFTGMNIADRYNRPMYEAAVKSSDRFQEYYMIMNQWLIAKQSDCSILDFFHDRGYRNIAIYGLTELGNRLYDELKSSDVNVVCAVDAGLFTCPYPELKLFRLSDFELSDESKEIDAIIVTPTFAFDSIKNQLSEYISADIIPIWSILDI